MNIFKKKLNKENLILDRLNLITSILSQDDLYEKLKDKVKSAEQDANRNFAWYEKEKDKVRFLEEYLMLNYCKPDFTHAFKNKRVNKEGLTLINSIYARVDSYAKEFDKVLAELKGLDQAATSQIENLKQELIKTRSHYQLK